MKGRISPQITPRPQILKNCHTRLKTGVAVLQAKARSSLFNYMNTIRNRGYLPFQTGFLFSKNDWAPSITSSVLNNAIWPSSIISTHCSTVRCHDR